MKEPCSTLIHFISNTILSAQLCRREKIRRTKKVLGCSCVIVFVVNEEVTDFPLFFGRGQGGGYVLDNLRLCWVRLPILVGTVGVKIKRHRMTQQLTEDMTRALFRDSFLMLTLKERSVTNII